MSEKSQTIDDVLITIAGNVSRQRACTISQFQKIKAQIKNVQKDEKRNKVCTFLMFIVGIFSNVFNRLEISVLFYVC